MEEKAKGIDGGDRRSQRPIGHARDAISVQDGEAFPLIGALWIGPIEPQPGPVIALQDHDRRIPPGLVQPLEEDGDNMMGKLHLIPISQDVIVRASDELIPIQSPER
jgi:hypothetical protein